jgi:hypothetical protein
VVLISAKSISQEAIAMEISIGGGPDFILTRGQELLNYRFDFELYVGDRCIKRKSFVHRSLAMVVKDSRPFLSSQRDDRRLLDWKWEIDVPGRSLNIIAPYSGSSAKISLKGPDGLLADQFDEIAGIFERNFKKI